MRAAIVQSSYIPWKGYFSLIHLVDHFVLLDDVQYTRRDWRNRNCIRTPQGLRWLSIPVLTKGLRTQRVCDATVADPGWAERHWRTISQSYRRAPGWAEIAPLLEGLYEACAGETKLSAVNERFLRAIAGLLGITTPLSWSMQYSVPEDRNERLIELCRRLGSTEYLTGPAARGYLDEARCAAAGLRIRWMDYGGYPDYPQVHGSPCQHQVTILDLLANLGRAGAAAYMADFRRGALRKIFGVPAGDDDGPGDDPPGGKS